MDRRAIDLPLRWPAKMFSAVFGVQFRSRATFLAVWTG